MFRMPIALYAGTLLLIGLAGSGCASDGAVRDTPTQAAVASRAEPAARTQIQVDPASSPDWSNDMARFAEEDSRTPPPSRPVLFTGSSSIRMWSDLPRDFPDVAVLNRGFGGSQMRDVYHYADPAVIHYQPRQVVLYSGDNDIHAGRSPQQVLHDFQAVVTRLRQDLPQVPILVLSIKPSPSRLAELPRQREANALIASAARQLPQVTFVDVSTPMLDSQGQPRPELFLQDQLHMTPAGYALWRKVVGPHLLH